MKNLMVARHLLEACIFNVKCLDDAWHLLLITLQHLCWVLQLKPSASSGLLEPPSGELVAKNYQQVMANGSANGAATEAPLAMNCVAQVAFGISTLMKKSLYVSSCFYQ